MSRGTAQKRKRSWTLTRKKPRTHRGLLFEELEHRLLLASDWQNPCNPLDVNDDGVVTPRDVLVLINRINSVGAGLLPVPSPAGSPPPFYDTTGGDQQLLPLDVLVVISAINGISSDAFIRFDGGLLRDTAAGGTTNSDGNTSDARVLGEMRASPPFSVRTFGLPAAR
jgi:Dockerin type I domain